MRTKIPPIPSEVLEPHLSAFLGSMIEYVAWGEDPDEVRQMIRGMRVFLNRSGGIHARLAFNNEAAK